MYIELRQQDWQVVCRGAEGEQKDYDRFPGGDVLAFVYGYPYYVSGAGWFRAQDAHAAYRKNGLVFLEEIDGVYSIVIIDTANRRCFVAVDRYGIYALFYRCEESCIALSDSVRELARRVEAPRLRRDSIIEYLYIGYKLGSKTHIEGVRQCEPATVYEIDRDLRMTPKRYWRLLEKSPQDRVSREEFRQRFDAHVRRGVELEERILFPLSGGLDTRTILSACLSERRRLHCYTYGAPGAADIGLARRISAHFGMDHSTYELDDKWVRSIPASLRSHAGDFNGLGPTLKLMAIEQAAGAHEAHGGLLVLGVLGNEVWRCHYGRFVVGARTGDEAAARIADGLKRWRLMLLDVFESSSPDEIAAMVEASLTKESCAENTSGNPAAAADVIAHRGFSWNWAANWVKAVGRRNRVFLAMCQKDLWQQMPLMPFEEKRQGAIQKYIISENNSFLANLPLDSGQTLRDGWFRKRREHISLRIRTNLERYLNSISRRIVGREIVRPRELHDYSMWLRTFHKEFILATIDHPSMATREFLKRDKLEALVRTFLDGDDSPADFLILLLSLETWLKTIALGGTGNS